MNIATRVALVLSLLLATCAKSSNGGDVETVVVVTVSGITSDLRILRANATLNGAAAQKIEDFVANPPAQQFGLSLPPNVTGPYSLQVEGVAANGCIVSRGQASTTLAGEVRVDLNVVLGALVMPDCSAVPVACSDEAQNGMETDVDCGGSICPRCDVGKACQRGGDCLTNVCTEGMCAPTSTCMNGSKDGSETDVDCGGPTCAKCDLGKSCLVGSDCANGSCVAGTCAAAPFTVTKVEPAEGPINMTVPITITGTGFMSGMTVEVGNAAATGVMVVSATQLKAVAPARATPAVVDLTVKLSGSGTATLTKGFRYYGGPVGFASPTLTATAGRTAGVAVADLNGDGKPDVAATSPNTNEVLVLLGKGDGTFLAGVPYAMGDYPGRVIAGDLNGDGKPDLVVTNANTDQLSVFLNSGAGTFAARRDYPAAVGVVGLVISDVTGDGKADVVVAHRGTDNGVSVLPGKGDGTLLARTEFVAGSSPNDVAAPDLNGDGKPDLLVANGANNYVVVLLNKGGGAFDTRVVYNTAFATYAVVSGDFNGDGKADAAVTSAGGTDMAVLLGKGDGTLQAPVVTTVGSGLRSLAAADLDKDGRLDAVAMSSGGANVLLGKGDGTFQAPLTIAGIRTGVPAGAGETLALSDLNGDGRLDIVSANGTSVAVLLGTAN